MTSWANLAHVMFRVDGSGPDIGSGLPACMAMRSSDGGQMKQAV